MIKKCSKVTDYFQQVLTLLCFTDGYQCFKHAASRHATGILPEQKLVTTYKRTWCLLLEDHNPNLWHYLIKLTREFWTVCRVWTFP